MKSKLTWIVLLTLFITSSLIVSSNHDDFLPALTHESKDVLVEDALIKMLFPYINKAVKEHYGTLKQYTFDKILEIRRLDHGQYYFEITLQVMTFEGAHNPPYGTEIITIRLDNEVYITDYKHKDGHPSGK